MKQSISFAYSVVVYDNYGETLYIFKDEKKAKELLRVMKKNMRTIKKITK